jgi:hypothetical protein
MDVHEEWARFEQQYKYMPRNSKEVERRYIRQVVAVLQTLGWTVLPLRSNDHCDLMVAKAGRCLYLEVKIARRTKRLDRKQEHYYQFKTFSGGIRPCDGDFCILAAFPQGPGSLTAFVVPTDQLGNRKKIDITSDPGLYRGQWAQFKDRWDILEKGKL